jgi:hypothetical protein
MKEKEVQQLTEGSSYQITSLGSRDEPIVTTGKFTGFAVVGAAEAVCIKLDKSHKKMAGKIRMIPSHMILTLDIITEAKKKEKTDEDALAKSYL